MGTQWLLPIWLVQAGDMSASITSQTIEFQFKDNVGIQVNWTGTPTGTLDVQVSMDPTNLGWQSVPFTPTPDQPAGTNGTDWYEITQSSASYVRLVYTRASGTGTLNAKIAIKSV